MLASPKCAASRRRLRSGSARSHATKPASASAPIAPAPAIATLAAAKRNSASRASATSSSSHGHALAKRSLRNTPTGRRGGAVRTPSASRSGVITVAGAALGGAALTSPVLARATSLAAEPGAVSASFFATLPPGARRAAHRARGQRHRHRALAQPVVDGEPVRDDARGHRGMEQDQPRRIEPGRGLEAARVHADARGQRDLAEADPPIGLEHVADLVPGALHIGLLVVLDHLGAEPRGRRGSAGRG